MCQVPQCMLAGLLLHQAAWIQVNWGLQWVEGATAAAVGSGSSTSSSSSSSSDTMAAPAPAKLL
jgi:hypothetical protein